MKLVRHETPESFGDRALEWLLRSEAEYNLLIGLVGQLQGKHAFEDPVYLATIENGGDIEGCAFRTPPFKFGLTRMSESAARAIAREVAELYPVLPAVLGDVEPCEAFADEWSSLKGVSCVDGGDMGIYELRAVIPVARPAAGQLRPVRAEEVELAAKWICDFERDAHMTAEMDTEQVRQLVREEALYFWEDGEPVSLAAARGPTPNGIRIGYVFTPGHLRGRGYASTAVAELSRLQLARGRKFCFLYTDLSNPTSNAIYRRLGYTQVAAVKEIRFQSAESRVANDE